MKREIKFRYIFQHEETGRMCSIIFNYVQIFNGECKAQYERLTGYFIVSKNQYTGLKDKNGKEIYEGDIAWLFGMRHTVVFKNGAFGYNTIEQPNNTYDYFIPFGANGHFEFENNQSNKIIVVGNIYENPELLK